MEFIYQDSQKERLDKFLSSQLSDITRSQIKKAILQGFVLVNGQKSTVHHWLKNNDKIIFNQVTDKPKQKFTLKPRVVKITEDYLIINKPSGLLSHPTDKGETNTLIDYLVKKFPQLKNVGGDPKRPALVQRLDKEVSGLMVVPLTPEFYNHLKKQFQERTIKKEYVALVHGQMINEQGEVRTNLIRDKKTGLMKTQAPDTSGYNAHTIYRVKEKFTNYTLLDVEIKTGRSHQIRTHLYSIGHSVVGDKLYQTKDLRKKRKTLDQRIFLHATHLEFVNLSGEVQKYNSPLPKELKDFLKTLK